MHLRLSGDSKWETGADDYLPLRVRTLSWSNLQTHATIVDGWIVYLRELYIVLFSLVCPSLRVMIQSQQTYFLEGLKKTCVRKLCTTTEG